MHKILAIVLMAACLVPTAATPASSPSPTALKQGFFRTVFGLEFGGGGSDAYRVKRFTDRVRFHVEDLSGLNRERTAKQFLRSLPSRIRHLRASVVAHREKANFRVILVKSADFADVAAREINAQAVAMHAKCLVGVQTVDGRILRSTAIIVADDAFLFQRCLVEEVLQGLGPMNDHASLTESVFNDTSRHTTLTAFDEALLNMLYHPAVRPGMTGRAVNRVLPTVMQDLGY